MEKPTCFVPVFAWMSQRDFAWQVELFFFVLASGRRQFKRGYSCFSFRLYFTIFIFGMKGSNTKRFCNLHVNLYFKSKPNTVSVFLMSVDVKHCRHVEHCFLVSREAQSAKHSSDVEFVASSVMFACWMSMDTCGQGWTAFHVLCNLLDEALQVRDSKPVALRSSGIHSHAQVRPADN